MNPLVEPAPRGPLLGVNIDHVATLRNARGGSYPDPVEAALHALRGGADIITFHLREDRRHIRDEDVARLREQVHAPLNFESALTGEMLDLIEQARPRMACLVPERRQELTTEGGLDVLGQLPRVREACARLAAIDCRVSLFIEADPAQIDAAVQSGAPCIELHTGAYANAVEAGDEGSAQRQFARIREAIARARAAGLQTNAGHGLTLRSTPVLAAMPEVRELHIGHALVAHALFVGMERAVRDFKACIESAAARPAG
jgi:pyridoxine 5-phosphate synthase